MRHVQCARLAGSALAGLLLVVAGCGKEDQTGGTRVPTAVTVIAGDQQAGQVGIPLSTAIQFRATDSRGGIPDVSITFSPSSGTVAPTTATTDANGDALVVWTLGGTLGPQTLTATAGSVTGTARATAAAGPASLVAALTETTQFVVVGRTVGIAPAVGVTDAFGNVISGVTVIFSVGPTGGTLTGGGARVTDQTGRAAVDAWQIGNEAANYTVKAEVSSGAFAIFSAFGVPASVQVFAGASQTANAGTQVPVAPAVIARREDGSPLANVPVNFLVTQGGGLATGTAVLTGSNGVATVGRWILGLTAGANRLEAQVLGAPTSVFQATGVQATAVSLASASVGQQNGFYGNFVGVVPTVTATDAQGNPVAGAGVTYQVSQGDGAISGNTPQSDFLGQAALGSWRLGQNASHAVTASAPGLPPVTFTSTASGVPVSEYRIEIRYLSGQPTPGQQAAFDAAVARWQSVIIGDAAEVPGGVPASSFCNTPAVPESIDDLIIFADLANIDGAGGVLGRAGPCFIRSESRLTVVGVMQFDVADLATLEANGRLNDVILHEMGHVIGFGTLWDEFDLLQGSSSTDPFFSGPSARGAFNAAAAIGTTFTGTPVPVEGTGGPGTRNSHWRESVLVNELMTGFLNSGTNPLSAFSLASLRDMGYVVNDAVADLYTFQARLLGGFGGEYRLNEAPIPGPILLVDRYGREVGRIPRL